MTAQILNLEQWLVLAGDEVSGDEISDGAGYYDGQLWEREAEREKAAGYLSQCDRCGRPTFEPQLDGRSSFGSYKWTGWCPRCVKEEGVV